MATLLAARSAFSLRSLAWSAFRAGTLQSVCLRSSEHAASGLVLVCAFSSPVRAGRFASRWARRLGISVAVRRPWHTTWHVSVPVRQASSRHPGGAGQAVLVAGGLRAFVQALNGSGLGRWS